MRYLRLLVLFAIGSLVVAASLELVGYDGTAPPGSQSDLAVQTIRSLTSFGPSFFLFGAVLVAFRYTLTRSAHQDILDQLEFRRRPKADPN